MAQASTQISWLRIVLMTTGVLAIFPVTVVFGLYGFLGTLFFILLAALAT